MFKRSQFGKRHRDADALAAGLEKWVEAETQHRLNLMTGIVKALEPGWPQKLEEAADFIMQAANIRHAIRSVRLGTTSIPHQTPRFQVSSLFLRDLHRYLHGDADGAERLTLVSGTISPEGVRILSRSVEVAMDKSSPAYVRAEAGDAHGKIVRLVEVDGHELMAMFHSHIMHGAESTRPSGVDLANQQRFSAIGWSDVIGGIFSIDGYVRLFSTATDFTIAVYGNGVDIVADTPREKILKLVMGA